MRRVDGEKAITIAEAARILQVSESSIRHHMNSGAIRTLGREGNGWRYLVSEEDTRRVAEQRSIYLMAPEYFMVSGLDVDERTVTALMVNRINVDVCYTMLEAIGANKPNLRPIILIGRELDRPERGLLKTYTNDVDVVWVDDQAPAETVRAVWPLVKQRIDSRK